MRLSKLLLIACSLALSGCWESKGLLLSHSEAVLPIPAGDYRRQSDGYVITVTHAGDGWYGATDDEEDSVLLLNPLGGNLYGLAAANDYCRGETTLPCTWNYVIVRVEGSRVQIVSLPFAQSREIALRHGAACSDSTCTFYSAASLRATMIEEGGRGGVRDAYTRE